MDMIRTAAYLLAVLSVLVIAHEWGHFIVAKLCKMRVDDFSLFFGPRLIRLGTRNGTEYNIRSVPLGGFVKIAGMEPEDLTNGSTTLRVNGKGVFLIGLDEARVSEIDADLVSTTVRSTVEQAVSSDGKLLDQGREDLNALLLPTGINAEEQKYIQAVLDAENYTPDPNGYNQKPLWQRAATIAAGPFVSLLFGYLLFCIMGVTVGLPYDGKNYNTIDAIVAKKPAARAGIKPGDKIVQIDDKIITDGKGMVDAIHAGLGKSLTIILLRDNTRLTKVVVPEAGQISDVVDGKPVKRTVGLIGIMPHMEMLWKRYSPVTSVAVGTDLVKQLVVGTFAGIFSKDVGENASGIIGIAGQIHKDSKEGPRTVAYHAAMLSISLGIINLFPIPILDGGHLMLLAWEGLRRRKLSTKEVYTAQLVGISIIGVLFVLVMYNDIMHVFVHRG
ncbi:MAG: putative rane-associated Zn-dependent protease 1 [Chthonomonadaceae bacterium]|nr:putative rane-associated Zn-dependent protease 1 [Chthonomonadaceae bacterium]